MKKWRYLFIVLGIFLLLFLGQKRYREINQRIQSPEALYFAMGEEVEMEKDILMNYTMEGYSITVTDAEILTYSEFLDKHRLEDVYSHVPEKVYEVEVVLRNRNADADTGINLSEFYVQKGAICASLDMNLYSQANPDLEGVFMLALRPESEIILRLPFALYQDSFKARTWKDLENQELGLVVTLYPVKKVISL